ncbi:uncharacterized protein [Apostichopus japonicus]|uniref:uncharacterized protein n=1 Tax=Stichopus japonicus TaxID=307972 RepID=UPI003AB6D7DE
MASAKVNVHQEKALRCYIITLTLCICVIVTSPVKGAKPVVSWGAWSEWTDCCGLFKSERAVRFRRPTTRTGANFKCYLDNAQCIQFRECVCGNNATEAAITGLQSDHRSTKIHGTPKRQKATVLNPIRRRRKRSTLDAAYRNQYGQPHEDHDDSGDYTYQWNNYGNGNDRSGRPAHGRSTSYSNRNANQPRGIQYDDSSSSRPTVHQGHRGTGPNPDYYNNYDVGNQDTQYTQYGDHNENVNNYYNNYNVGNQDTQYTQYGNHDENVNNYYNNYNVGNQDTQYTQYGDHNENVNNYQHYYDGGLNYDHHHNNEVAQNYNGYDTSAGRSTNGLSTNNRQAQPFGVGSHQMGNERHTTDYDEYYEQYMQRANDPFNEYMTQNFDDKGLPPETVERLQTAQEQILQEIKTLNVRLQESKDVITHFTNEVTHLEDVAFQQAQIL